MTDFEKRSAIVKYLFEPFTLDDARRELRCNGHPVHLQPQVFDLLCLLIENAHRVVSRDEIFEKVWKGRIVSEDALSSRIRDLRRVLSQAGQDPSLIQTVRGYGFRFMGDVSLHAATRVSDEVHGRGESGGLTAAEPSAALHTQPSIAVLPFQRNGDLDRFEAIEEAIPRELIMTLASLRWIRVVSHGSAFRFRGRQIDLAQVNQILNARYCLTGVIDLSGNRITIDTELSDTRSSEVIWALRKSANIDDIHALRAEIAANVIMVAELEIPQHETSSLMQTEGEALDAWSAMHLGFRHMSQFSQTGNEMAKTMLGRALELDPLSARANAGMAFVHFQNAFLRYMSNFAREAEKCPQVRGTKRGIATQRPVRKFHDGPLPLAGA